MQFSFTVKDLFNIGSIFIIATLSIYHLFIFIGRYERKSEKYNLYFSLTGLFSILHIWSINFLPAGRWNLVIIQTVVALAILFTVISVRNIVKFPSVANRIFNIGLFFVLTTPIMTLPVLFLGREWYFTKIYIPILMTLMTATFVLLGSTVFFLLRNTEWKTPVHTLLIIALSAYGLNSIMSMVAGLAHIQFLQYNYMFIGLFYFIFAYALALRFNNDYHQALLQEAQEQFFINFTHETRTPLTLLKNAYDNVTQQYNLSCKDSQIVKQSIDKLLKDIDNFLDRKKLISGSMLYDHNQTFNLSKLVQLECDLFHSLTESKGIHLISHIEEGIVIKAAYNAIDRVFINLLDNAVNYTDKEGEIRVSLVNENESIRLIVIDTGKGIEEEDLENLFNPFYQSGKQKRNSKGLGQGLAMSKSIIDQIEGAGIKAESQPGDGSTFTLTFAPCLEPGNVIDQEQMTLNKNITPSAIPEDSPIIKGRKNILIVEDHTDMLDYLNSSLSEYNRSFAVNGEEALNKLDNIPVPDLIISDIMMDKMTGEEFRATLLEDDKYSDIPFIFLTAKAEEKEKENGLKLGAIDYITKPFSINELKSKIDNQFSILARLKKKAEGITEDDIEQYGNGKGLTEREKEILYFSSRGLQEKDIARELCISLSTVKNHKSKIFEKTEIRSIRDILQEIEI